MRLSHIISSVTLHDLSLKNFESTIHASAQAIERAFCLSLRHSAYQRAADDRPDRTERGTELVVIVKARAPIARRAQDVFRASARTCRSPTLPHGPLAGAAVDELPVNLEADSTQMDLLVHPVAHARWPVIGVVEPAVNAHPVAQAIW